MVMWGWKEGDPGFRLRDLDRSGMDRFSCRGSDIIFFWGE